MESFTRSNDSKWLSQFGLYRYQSADPKKSKYRQISFIIYGIFGVASIVIFATFFVIIVQSNLKEKTIIISSNPQQTSTNNYSYNSYNPPTTTTVSNQNDTDEQIIELIRDEHLEPLHQDYDFDGNKNDTSNYDEDDNDNNREARNGTLDDFDEYDASGDSGDNSEVVEDLDKISAERLTLAEGDLLFRPMPRRPRRKKKRRQMANRRQFDTRVTYYEPRPFDFELNGPTPASFQKPINNFSNTGMTTYTLPSSKIRVHNIQDILNQGEVMSDAAAPNDNANEMNRIQFTGTYRHPKKYNELMGIFSQHYPRIPIPQPTVYPNPTIDYYPSSTTQFSADPFYKYKPKTPSDINLMALNQFRFAPYGHKSPIISSSSSIVPSATPTLLMKTPTYPPPIYSPVPTKYFYPMHPPPQSSEYENIYHALLNSNHGSTSDSSSSSSEKRIDGSAKKTKPFSLMLDIYPMTDDDSISSSGNPSTKRPGYRYRRPLQPSMYPPPGLLNQYSPAVGDHSYFNSINFPQLQQQQQQRYPLNTMYNSHYLQSKHRNNNNNHYGNNPEEGEASSTYEKPGQMVVHLNLFPKGNRNRNKHKQQVDYLDDRSSEEANDSHYDGSYDFQPRSMNTQSHEITAATTEMSLNTGEVLSTNAPQLLNATHSAIEIVRSIELNATEMNFDRTAKNTTTTLSNQTSSRLAVNPIVVIPNSKPVETPINRSDDYDIHDLEFIDDHKVPAIPHNHRLNNATATMRRESSNFTVELMRFEPKDVVMKQSERDYFAQSIV